MMLSKPISRAMLYSLLLHLILASGLFWSWRTQVHDLSSSVKSLSVELWSADTPALNQAVPITTVEPVAPTPSSSIPKPESSTKIVESRVKVEPIDHAKVILKDKEKQKEKKEPPPQEKPKEVVKKIPPKENTAQAIAQKLENKTDALATVKNTIPKEVSSKNTQPEKSAPSVNANEKVIASSKPSNSSSFEDDLLAGIDSAGTSTKSTSAKSSGGSGAASATVKVDMNPYFERVRNKIRALIIYPPDLLGNPQAQMRVTLNPQMEITSVTLLKSSGHAAYDLAIQNAIWQAKSFPALPSEAKWQDYKSFTLSFRPN